MKKFTLLILTLMFSATAFAQRISITDFCYKQGGVIKTYEIGDIKYRLGYKGFSHIKTSKGQSIGPGGYVYTFNLFTYYHRSTNTYVVLSEGMPQTITFNSTSDANLFITEAVRLGYVVKSENYYNLTSYNEYDGIDGFSLIGRVVHFGWDQP